MLSVVSLNEIIYIKPCMYHILRMCELETSILMPCCIIGVGCGPLLSPANRTVAVSNTTFPSVAMYNCDNEFILIGVSRRECQASGSWSDQAPLCISEYILYIS